LGFFGASLSLRRSLDHLDHQTSLIARGLLAMNAIA
jgi:hypothetical protein